MVSVKEEGFLSIFDENDNITTDEKALSNGCDGIPCNCNCDCFDCDYNCQECNNG